MVETGQKEGDRQGKLDIGESARGDECQLGIMSGTLGNKEKKDNENIKRKQGECRFCDGEPETEDSKKGENGTMEECLEREMRERKKR